MALTKVDLQTAITEYMNEYSTIVFTRIETKSGGITHAEVQMNGRGYLRVYAKTYRYAGTDLDKATQVFNEVVEELKES